MTDGTVYVTTRDQQVGLLKRACPYCETPITIRLPSMADAIRDFHNRRISDATRLGFTDLTPCERRVFDTVYAGFPQAVDFYFVMEELSDMSRRSIRQHSWRLRRKLAPKGWQLVAGHDTLRLVEPEEGFS